MKRVVLISVLLSLGVLVTKCGDDGGSGPKSEGDPEGFTVKYQRGEYLGNNGCKRLGDSYTPVYSYDIWFDWWTATPSEVDQVIFACAGALYMWYWEGAGYVCVDDTVGYENTPGRKDDNHWKLMESEYGAYGTLPGGVYMAFEFVLDTLATAHVFYKDGGKTTFTTYPVAK